MITIKLATGQELDFEHSLVSLSDWEAEYEKPFYSPTKEGKTEDEMLKYFEYMMIGPRRDRYLVYLLTEEQQVELANYINRSRTATTVRDIPGKGGPQENITSELIYYWLSSFKIPFSPTEEWHLNRILTLVKIHGVKNQPPSKNKQKVSADRVAAMRAENERRLAAMGTKG